jgi:pilus assembly protein Flp/PilA
LNLPAYSKDYLKGDFFMLFAPIERGQGLVEYAFLLAFVTLVVIAALMIFGPSIGNVFSSVNRTLSSV